MRKAFVAKLVELAAADPRVVLLTGDLGFMVLEGFRDRFPGRFFNVGVAEQNMIGLATGLAEAGRLPFLYSISPFATLRGFEQLRVGPGHHGLPVRVVGVGAGFDYGHAGFTHHALEDVAVMRCLPGFRVVAPATDADARTWLDRTYADPGPVYYRLGKDPRSGTAGVVAALAAEAETEAGAATAGPDGRPVGGPGGVGAVEPAVALVALGGAADLADEVGERLAEAGVASTLVLIRDVVRGQVPGLAARLGVAPLVVTLEDHGVLGGLGTMAAEVMAEEQLPGRLVRVGVPAATAIRGGRDALREAAGLTPERVAERILRALGRASRGR